MTTNPVSVPEPAPVALFGIALVALLEACAAMSRPAQKARPSPDNTTARLWLGHLDDMAGNFNDAIANYQAALRLVTFSSSST